MDLKHPWLWVIVALLLVAAVALAWSWAARRGTPVADTADLASSATYRGVMRRHRAGLACLLLVAIAALASATLVASRPVDSVLHEPDDESRDIMLCLDVSGSMAQIDQEILTTIESIGDELEGDRIGLTIWNSTAMQVLPLMDDQEYVKVKLAEVRQALQEGDYDYFQPTMEIDYGSSLIGDGLGACVDDFDHPDDDRPRSIILATDNDVSGDSVLSLPEATEYAKSKDIRVFTLAPTAQNIEDAYRRMGGPPPLRSPEESLGELRTMTESTGGQYYTVGDSGQIDGIVEGITEQEAARLEAPAPQRITFDDPAQAVVGLGIIVLCLLGVAVVVDR